MIFGKDAKLAAIKYSGTKLSKHSMNYSYFPIELEQDGYGSAVFPLPDELCHDMGLVPGERFDIEVEDDVIMFKRLAAGYEIE